MKMLPKSTNFRRFKINVKKTKSLRIEINEGKEVMLGNEQIDQVDSFINLGIVISIDGGCSADIRSKIAKV